MGDKNNSNPFGPFSTCVKGAGVAIPHSRKRILFYIAGSRNGLEGVASGGIRTHEKKSNLRKIYLFVCWGRQTGSKNIPDVIVESIMKSPGPLKEETRRILSKIYQFQAKITKIRVSISGCAENQYITVGGQHSKRALELLIHFRPKLTLPSPNESKKNWFQPLWGYLP